MMEEWHPLLAVAGVGPLFAFVAFAVAVAVAFALVREHFVLPVPLVEARKLLYLLIAVEWVETSQFHPRNFHLPPSPIWVDSYASNVLECYSHQSQRNFLEEEEN